MLNLNKGLSDEGRLMLTWWLVESSGSVTSKRAPYGEILFIQCVPKLSMQTKLTLRWQFLWERKQKIIFFKNQHFWKPSLSFTEHRWTICPKNRVVVFLYCVVQSDPSLEAFSVCSLFLQVVCFVSWGGQTWLYPGWCFSRAGFLQTFSLGTSSSF